MTTHIVRTTMRSELKPVELAWDALLRLDGGQSDFALFGALSEFFNSKEGRWVLVGQRDIGTAISSSHKMGVRLEMAVIDGRGPLTEKALDDLAKRTAEQLAGQSANVFLCLTDRYDARRLIARLPEKTSVYTFDVLKELLGERLPAAMWRKKFDHVYPIEIPEIRVQPDLDVLLLDLPARSLAQLPIGFAYVYKALRQTGVNLQAIDVDLVAYHRYHSRRCLNYLERIHSDGLVHPEDPWQPENYVAWTEKKYVEYFTDLLDEVIEKVVAARPRIIGFSLHQTSHSSVTYVVERLRERLPEACIIVGGMSCLQHFVARRIFPMADYVVVGEADTVIGPLVAALARGERPADVPGVVSPYDSEDRTFIGSPLPHNLDVLGAPDYSFTDLDLYVNWNGYRLMPLVGTRGCGWSRCTFCAERFNWRARTPENVAEEIEYYTTRGFKDFVFNESDFNSNPSFVIRLCQDIVRRGIKANFTAQLRIGKDCDFEYYKAMKEAGFSCLRFGVDGLSENTLRLQRKGYTKEMVLENLGHCHDLGIFTEINVVIGVPGETDEDVEESADFIIEMKPYIGRVAFINPLMLFVGSVYYFEPEHHNIKFNGDKDELYSKYFVSLPDTAWYSEEPYIDHEIRRQRYFRIVDRIREAGVPLGSFASFTAEFRRQNLEGTELLTQPKVKGVIGSGGPADENPPAGNAEERSVSPWADELLTPRSQPGEKTEFQNTFYGSWSSALLSGDFARWTDGPGLEHERVVRIQDEFYVAVNSVAEDSRFTVDYPVPTLLGPYKGYNLVGYHDEVLAAPLVLGPCDLTQDRARSDPRILKAGAVEQLEELIDRVESAVSLITMRQPRAISLRASVQRFALHAAIADGRPGQMLVRTASKAIAAARAVQAFIPRVRAQGAQGQMRRELPVVEASLPRAVGADRVGSHEINRAPGVMLRWKK